MLLQLHWNSCLHYGACAFLRPNECAPCLGHCWLGAASLITHSLAQSGTFQLQLALPKSFSIRSGPALQAAWDATMQRGFQKLGQV